MEILERTIKQLKDIERLDEIESFILKNGRSLTKEDENYTISLGTLMEEYTYGWYILDDGFLQQLEDINQFKIYIISLMKGE